MPKISIHAPREGSDSDFILLGQQSQDFNPRSPRGERLKAVVLLFLLARISIHAPREGSDYSCPAYNNCAE